MPLIFTPVDGARVGAPFSVSPTQVILGGYTARSAGERQRHIDELEAIGIAAPASAPAFWRVARHLLTTKTEIEVQGGRTSGECEYALIVAGGRIWVTVASDQTDRELERVSIPRSKQLCPKALGTDAVALDELLPVWDDIELSSDISSDGANWIPYQRAKLAALLDPATLLRASGLGDTPADGAILLSGTVAIVDGVTRFLPYFRAALDVPGRDLTLRLTYRVDVLPEIVPQLGEQAG